MGPSGCGKTTLLNYLTSNSTKEIGFNGDMIINGHQVTNFNEFKHRFAYVYQDDVLYEHQTVYQHILASARLAGLDNPIFRTEKIITYLGLEKVMHSKIGGVLSRGISGGEKKRVAIANEIISDPSIIFLDEPTTGLDAKSALDLGELMKTMAKGGRTLISTIHQPSNELLNTFDKVLIMNKGEIIFDGPP